MRFGNSLRLVALQVLLCSILFCSDAMLRSSLAENPSSTHLYFITNDGCAPCLQVEPGIEALKHEGYPVTTVKFSEHPQWASQLGVDRTPTVIMISNNKMVGRHEGLIDAVTLKQWFAVQGIHSGSAFRESAGSGQPGGTKVLVGPTNRAPAQPGIVSGGQSPDLFSTPTMLQGTARPGTEQERLALQATVRLKVQDPEGTSYATGTVVHCHQGECLVMTCGHVFRDAQGNGVITADYGFADGNLKTAEGQLISYDAGARDIGLVAIQTQANIVPIPIANSQTSIDRGLDIFSIGCDHGDAPTIRRSRIKNRAAYDGAIKYDIYGRPVNGRSGGGMFTSKGELVGVCNAAAVEVDEGIYTALDTIYWQLAKAKLGHLFDDQQMVASVAAPRRPVAEMPVDGLDRQTFASRSNGQQGFSEVTPSVSSPNRLGAIPSRQSNGSSAGIRSVVWGQQPGEESDREIIILVRSKSDPRQTETITIRDPGPKLLDYLGTMRTRNASATQFQLRAENQLR